MDQFDNLSIEYKQSPLFINLTRGFSQVFTSAAGPLNDSGVRTFNDLRQLIKENSCDLQEKLLDMKNETRIEPSGRIPAVCLREVRVILMANTTSLRSKFDDPALTFGGLIELMKEFIPMIDPAWTEPGLNPKDLLRLQGTGKKYPSIDLVQPMIWFVCTGLGLKANVNMEREKMPLVKIHGHFSIGATQERLACWQNYHQIRHDARNDHIGPEDRAKWHSAYKALQKFDDACQLSGKSQSDGRAELVYHALKGAKAPAALRALPEGALDALRNCGGHIGIPYAQGMKHLKAVGCCYGCKVCIRYIEAMSDEALRNDIVGCPEKGDQKAKPGTVNTTDFANRMGNPHSCAEVAASIYC
ncbi:hypothetical protein ACHAP5_012040 [Fusarium lateritium]